MGLSQNRLAEILEMDRSAISRIESGDRDPRLSEAISIAEALRMELFTYVNSSARTFFSHMQSIRGSMVEARRQTLRAISMVNVLNNAMSDEAKSEVVKITGYKTYPEAFAGLMSSWADNLQSGSANAVLEMESRQPYFDSVDRGVKAEIVRGVVENILVSEEELFRDEE